MFLAHGKDKGKKVNMTARELVAGMTPPPSTKCRQFSYYYGKGNKQGYIKNSKTGYIR